MNLILLKPNRFSRLALVSLLMISVFVGPIGRSLAEEIVIIVDSGRTDYPFYANHDGEGGFYTHGGPLFSFRSFSCHKRSGGWYENGRIPCGPDIERAAVSCTIAGGPVPFVTGVDTFDIRWSSGGTSVADRPNPSSDSSGSLSLWVGERSNTYYVGPESFDIVCTTDLSATGLPVHYNNMDESPKIITYRRTFSIVNYYGVSVTPPDHVYGLVNQQLSMPFSIKYMDRYNGTVMSWSVSPPCSEWSPLLIVDGDSSQLEADDSASVYVSVGEHRLTAKFLPTVSGEFTCVGTLRLTRD